MMTTSHKFPLPLHVHHQNNFISPVLYFIMKIQQYKRIFICIGGAILLPIIIPYIHLGIVYQLWDKYTMKVNRETCSCSCWDTAFKGKCTYIKMSFTVYVLMVIVEHTQVEYSVTYTTNDSAFLAVMTTEHGVGIHTFTAIVKDVNNPVTPRKLLIIMDIAILHIVASGSDQFVANVLRREGDLHQILRDVGFMIPDLLHVALPLAELIKYAKNIGMHPAHLISNTDFIGSLLFIFSFWLICVKL
ncbi:uncharacterized protein LOC111622105 [Centruroides sculpturatus]|uniref:uncharacterized protein LOC111622105 n=1 Tax=Centruroides sculpturatus TaxID=218467 RepID=UPI000C6E3B56|nr:uncharacterized protein LOC111622105 [Centruroides sculpturatus]